MDCDSFRDRVAPFVEGQLGPAESEQMGTHIDRCSHCADLITALDQQVFSPLTSEERTRICGVGGFWSDMDSVLAEQMGALHAPRSGSAPWTRRRVAMPVPMIIAYAAALTLAVVWGMSVQQRADRVEVAIEKLSRDLEIERRLASDPKSERIPSAYRVVNHTPQRGTF